MTKVTTMSIEAVLALSAFAFLAKVVIYTAAACVVVRYALKR
jgi:hypothetical protein